MVACDEVVIGETLSSSFTEGRLTIPEISSFGIVIELVPEVTGFEGFPFELVSLELTVVLDEVEVFLLEVELLLLEVEFDLDEVGSLLVVAESELAKDEVSLSVKTDDISDLFTGVVVQATKQKQSITDIKSANNFFIFCYLLQAALGINLISL